MDPRPGAASLSLPDSLHPLQCGHLMGDAAQGCPGMGGRRRGEEGKGEGEKERQRERWERGGGGGGKEEGEGEGDKGKERGNGEESGEGERGRNDSFLMS